MPPALAPFHTRWLTFVDKIRARVREIENEGVVAYREVIAIDVIDGTGVTGVSSALKARLIAIRQKVDDAFSKIDNEMDAVDIDDTKGAARWRATLMSAKSSFTRELERITETVVVYGEAEAARALQALAHQEAHAPLGCTQCGAQLQRPSWHETVNVTCPSCRTVTTATAGTAAMMFTKGAGAIALAFEAALPAWYARQDAEKQWHALRHKTLDDLARWLDVNRAYHQAFAEAMARNHPGWTAQTIVDEVRGKMSHYELHEAKDDRQVRENNGAGIAAVGTNDPAHVMGWLGRQRDSDSAREELITALVERGWNDHARWVAQISGLPPDDLEDIHYYFSTRGD